MKLLELILAAVAGLLSYLTGRQAAARQNADEIAGAKQAENETLADTAEIADAQARNSSSYVSTRDIAAGLRADAAAERGSDKPGANAGPKKG
ncbi:MAG: hypothetical protein KGL46_03925 [Hyphomicrobiales bacterium]|nr:hypothetical protein [Hyphomicrobiales bacterium]